MNRVSLILDFSHLQYSLDSCNSIKLTRFASRKVFQPKEHNDRIIMDIVTINYKASNSTNVVTCLHTIDISGHKRVGIYFVAQKRGCARIFSLLQILLIRFSFVFSSVSVANTTRRTPAERKSCEWCRIGQTQHCQLMFFFFTLSVNLLIYTAQKYIFDIQLQQTH